MNKNIYLERYAYPEKLIKENPDDDLSIIVTIPSFNEPAAERAVSSLAACDPPQGNVEVLILVNHPENATDEVIKRSADSFINLIEAADKYSRENFRIFVLLKALPSKHAGVGRARKILMDEAVRRFELIGNDNGIITAFDADCTCEKNYFTAIQKFFTDHPKADGCSIYFEHPISADDEYSEEIINAAREYELHLRCYIDALRWCKIPHAFQTIGSSMAVNNKAYQRQGGMNSRKAGEDFYFLHRIIREGNFGDVVSTKVIPSPRISERVPFGTGKAVINRLKSGTQTTYNNKSYILIQDFIKKIDNFYGFDGKSASDFRNFTGSLSPEIAAFLQKINFEDELIRIISHSSSDRLFHKHFFQWFDGFKVMKCLHFLRSNGYPEMPVEEAAIQIRGWLSSDSSLEGDNLTWYRKYDQKHPKYLQY